MKVLFINSSARKEGVTTTLLNEMRNGLQGSHQINWVDLMEASIKPCIGCMKCRPDKECIQPRDDGHRIGDLIKKSDTLIIGTPCYWGNMSGQLKTLFDRNVTTFESIGTGMPIPRLSGKKAVLVVSSAAPFPLNRLSSQSKGTEMTVTNILKAGGIKNIQVLNVPNSRNFSKLKARWLKKAAVLSRKIK